MRTTIFLSAALVYISALESLASAFVYPSTPIGNTVWKPDSTVTIAWTDDKQAPLLSSKPVFDIFLMTGSDDHQTKLATIATNVKGGTTKNVKYVVPHVSPPGQIYFLMFQTKDGKGTAWATRFTITDEKGNRGTLRPTIPPGGKINPGGVGSIIAPPKKKTKEADKGAAPAKKTPVKAPVKPNTAEPVASAAAEVKKVVKAPHAEKDTDTDPSLVHVDLSASHVKGEHNIGARNSKPWLSIAVSSLVTGVAVLLCL
ncbi:hypothetical protein BGZ94_008696 [Podila epigama]|nr:hypothetical protein BGZ94_008696 [Podila epigama]